MPEIDLHEEAIRKLTESQMTPKTNYEKIIDEIAEGRGDSATVKMHEATMDRLLGKPGAPQHQQKKDEGGEKQTAI